MSKKKLIAIIAAVLAVIIAVSVVFVVKNKNTNEEETTTEVTTENTTAEEVKAVWVESAEDFVYNAPSYLGDDPVMWTPPIYGSYVYQMIDLDFDEIPEIVVYSQGVSGGIFLTSVFSFDGSKYVEGEINGYSMETSDGVGMIGVYKNTETDKIVFRAGDIEKELLSSYELSAYCWSTFKNYYVSREFTFENGVLNCSEYSNEKLLEKLISETLDDEIRYEAQEKAQEYVEAFWKKYTPVPDYKSTVVNIYSIHEYTGDENADACEIYHTYVDKAFAEKFVNGYIQGEKRYELPVNVSTWEEGVENLFLDMNSFPVEWLELEILKFDLMDMNGDKIPEILVEYMSPTGGHTGLMGVYEWDADTCLYEINKVDESINGTISFCRENSTGENVVMMGLLEESWFESDNLDEHTQDWRIDGKLRKLTYSDGKVICEELADCSEELNLLGYGEEEAPRKEALEKLRKEAADRNKKYTDLAPGDELYMTLFSAYPGAVFADRGIYYDSITTEKIENLIEAYKSII